MLSTINKHPRDDNIKFEEEGHQYTIVDNGINITPTSVTTLIHNYFSIFDPDSVIDKMMKSRNWSKSKYFGKTKEEIKDEWKKSGEEASSLGTLMHKDIENYLNGLPVNNPDTKEFKMFLKFYLDLLKIYPTLKIYRTEWLVYDEDIKLAGSIDCVLSDDKGNLVLLDWKRSKEIKMSNSFSKGKCPFENLDDCNYEHYSLQLNFYRHILETKYKKNVLDMMIIVLHPNQDIAQFHQIRKIDLSSFWKELNV